MNGEALAVLIQKLGEDQGMRAYVILCEAGFKIVKRDD